VDGAELLIDSSFSNTKRCADADCGKPSLLTEARESKSRISDIALQAG
jgi:hypothetical protein